MKHLGTSYLLATAGYFTPFAGLHRFYLGRPISGLLYLFTWGLLGIGTLIDLIILPHLVNDENRKLLGDGVHVHIHDGQVPEGLIAARVEPEQKKSKEQQILSVAEQNEGRVTVELVALKTGMSLKDSKKELERLFSEGYCTVDVTEEGAKLYVFTGLLSTEPLLI